MDMTMHETGIVYGDELVSRFAELAGESHVELHDNVVEAVAAILHFARSECGPTAHYTIAQQAVIHVDAVCELAALAEPAGEEEPSLGE